ncbi:hypothetical protein ES288_A05G346500v1 [Gossypium darwinii]|uniref:Uncharacterized protein n=1 Tax=Gossypium darwinii TaxID=34276 RepID=A0A5D2GN92_GOSDA|nr:hypothetical protein ES288_A05G346500v1 [Gossypium darwinii]
MKRQKKGKLLEKINRLVKLNGSLLNLKPSVLLQHHPRSTSAIVISRPLFLWARESPSISTYFNPRFFPISSPCRHARASAANPEDLRRPS